jgi:hypothetical protein
MNRLLRLTAVCAFIWMSAAGLRADGDHPGGLRTEVTASAPTVSPGPAYVGLRRSSYGLRKFNTNDLWWVDCAKQYASNFPGSQPLILHILSNYQDDGTTQIEFRKPAAYRGSTTNMSFLPRGKLDHERALTTYDQQGVKAILQFEPGSADVGDCFELAQATFGRHPCIIGMAIDGEWFKTKDSKDQTGLPIPDAEAKRWMEQVLQFNPDYLLVLKHFETKNLPPTFRHPHLWLLTDSQEFASKDEWMDDMRKWSSTFRGSPIGSQFGYPKDQKWWVRSEQPPLDLGRMLTKELPDFRMLLWVDFTANRVRFTSP